MDAQSISYLAGACRKLDISIGGAAILAKLQSGPATMKMLANAAGVTNGAATGLVERLIILGFVSRSSVKDRRVGLRKLTALGLSVSKIITSPSPSE